MISRCLFTLPDLADQAFQLAQTLGLQVESVSDVRQLCRDSIERAEVVLWLDADGLGLRQLSKEMPGVVRVDFASGAAQWRRLHGGGRGEMIAKACGIKKGYIPDVLDATAGLGRDAFVLASLGCRVQMCERSAVIRALLSDGLHRATRIPEIAGIVSHLQLVSNDAVAWLQSAPASSVDVVYLDPMFPHRDSSARIKKDMAAFQACVGADEDSDSLLVPARRVARRRVVVKRPRLAPTLADTRPSLVIEGKSSRFDVYLSPVLG